MFTDNYIKFQKQRFAHIPGSPMYNNRTGLVSIDGRSVAAYGMHFSYTDIGGWLKFAKCQVLSTNESNSEAMYTTNPGVYFGSGSTPATKSDYKLESPITSGLTITNPSELVWKDDGNGKYEVSADYVVRNTTDAEISIREIGVFTPIANGYNRDYNTIYFILMERTVLDEPVVIPAGEAKMVTYKFTFNQPA